MKKKFIITIFFIFFNILLANKLFNMAENLRITFWDEFHWIGKTYFFDYFFLKRDKGEVWATEDAIDQPFIVPFVYGALIYFRYKDQVNKEGDFTRFIIKRNFYQILYFTKQNYEKIKYTKWNVSDHDKSSSELINKYGINFKKTIEIILFLRKFNAILLIISYFIFSFLGYLVTKSLLFSVILYANISVNSFYAKWNIYANADGLLYFFYTIIILILTIYAKNKNRDLFYNSIYLIILSFIISISINIKLIGLICIIYTLIIITIKFIEYNNKVFLLTFHFLLFISSILIFWILFNPSLFYGYFNISEMLNYRLNTHIEQSIIFNNSLLPTPFKALLSIVEKIFFNKEYFHFNQEFFFLISGLINLLLFFFGCYLGLSYKIMKIYLTIFLINVIFFISLFKLNWDRYYLMFVPFTVFFHSYAIYRILRSFGLLRKMIERLSYKNPPKTSDSFNSLYNCKNKSQKTN